MRIRAAVALAACLAAPLLAGCGSGGASAPAATAPSPAAPTAQSTQPPRGTRTSPHSTPGAPARHPAPAGSSIPPAGSASATAVFTKTVLPVSTPISSTQYHDALVSAIEAAKKSPQTAEAIAGCMQQVLQNAGFHTVGDANVIKRNPSGDKRVVNGTIQCLASAA